MSRPLKVVFAGTPEFAASHLQAILDSRHEVICVMSQPDRPSGRGRKLVPTPVKQVALDNNLPIWQPQSLKDPEAQSQFKELNADIMVVVAYGLILPLPILESPRLGCINVHGSLLPAWRGAAPIQRAIMQGDTKSGVTIMQMDEGLDTGDMLLKAECDIYENDTSAQLHDRLIEVGCPSLVQALDLLSQGLITGEVQNNDLATYAHKLSKEEAVIDWSLSALEVHNNIRGLNPWPVATTMLNDDRMRVWSSECVDQDSIAETVPGKILAVHKQGLDIQCGKGVLRITSAQLPGGKVLAISDLLNSKSALIEACDKLGSN